MGYLIGGPNGAIIALLVAAATNLFAYWHSDRMVLSMYGAHEVDARTAPDLHHLVAELAGRAGHRAYVHRQSALGARHGQPVRHRSVDGEPDRGVATTGRTIQHCGCCADPAPRPGVFRHAAWPVGRSGASRSVGLMHS